MNLLIGYGTCQANLPISAESSDHCSEGSHQWWVSLSVFGHSRVWDPLIGHRSESWLHIDLGPSEICLEGPMSDVANQSRVHTHRQVNYKRLISAADHSSHLIDETEKSGQGKWPHNGYTGDSCTLGWSNWSVYSGRLQFAWSSQPF